MNIESDIIIFQNSGENEESFDEICRFKYPDEKTSIIENIFYNFNECQKNTFRINIVSIGVKIYKYNILCRVFSESMFESIFEYIVNYKLKYKITNKTDLHIDIYEIANIAYSIFMNEREFMRIKDFIKMIINNDFSQIVINKPTNEELETIIRKSFVEYNIMIF